MKPDYYIRALIAGLVLSSVASFTAAAPTVAHIGLAAPDIIVVEVIEGEILRGQITPYDSGTQTKPGGLVKSPQGESGMLVGPGGQHFRSFDRYVGERLDRSAVMQARGYTVTGNKESDTPVVVDVYRKSVPLGSAQLDKGVPYTPFRHLLFLRLNEPLDDGEYSLTFPDAALPVMQFKFDDELTRSYAIHGTQLGFRPQDVSKRAYLSLWLPYGPANGAVDFREYKDKGQFDGTFQIVDDNSQVVHTGDIKHHIGPTDPETGGKGPIRYQDRQSRWEANRAATHVFVMDFSLDQWKVPAAGTYRVVLPGLGTSYSFEISDNVWQLAAQTAIAGLYHHRSGIALDGRFGYERPKAYHPDVGTVVLQSRMPLTFSKEGGGWIDFKEAAKAPWLTTETVSEAWGGYMDAGDWDRRIQHLEVSYALMLLHEVLPAAARDVDFRLPATREVLTTHPAFATLDLPDLLDEALWNIDFYRRLQRSDGAVRGGVESAAGPPKLTPSWLETQVVFAYAPDAWSTFRYVAGAAKLSELLKPYSEDASELFRNSAIAGWGWANTAYRDLDVSAEEAITLLGDEYEQVELTKRLEKIYRRTADSRVWAAAALYRLTGASVYQEVVEDRFIVQGKHKIGGLQGVPQHSAWEYLRSSHANVNDNLQTAMKKRLVSHVRTWMTDPIDKGETAFPALKHKAAPLGWGQGSVPDLSVSLSVIRAHVLSGSDEFLRVMLDSSSFILGANPLNLSLTTGIGQHQVKYPLHVDHMAMGAPAPIGITVYGFNPYYKMNFWWLFAKDWSTLSDEIPERAIYPYRKSLPVFESLFDHPGVISSAEYTVHQTIASTASIWTYLQFHDADTRLR